MEENRSSAQTGHGKLKIAATRRKGMRRKRREFQDEREVTRGERMKRKG